MVDMTTLMTYIAVVFGFVFIPGPAILLTVARATGSGPRVGIATGAGIATGDLIHTLLTVVGISAVVAASAFLFSVIKYLGSVYLIIIGIRAILDKDATMPGSDAPRVSVEIAFRQAIVAEVLNPKTALFFLAFLPQFVKPESGHVTIQLVIFGFLFVGIGLFSTIVYALCAGGIGGLLRRHPAVSRWRGKVVGGIYCAVGIRLAMQQR